MDPYFQVRLLAATPMPQTLVWRAMHQDYSECLVADESAPAEDRAGAIAVRRLLSSDRGHYGVLEHPQISFNCGWFPHSVMQQARTHRVAVSFDVQSMRYTGDRICKAASGELSIEEVVYLRSVGYYFDRQGKRYHYCENWRSLDLADALAAAKTYAAKMQDGMAEEHARGALPFDVRQHFVVSFTLRSLLHFMDLRSKADAQLEIRQLCELMWPHVRTWTPEIAAWYEAKRLGKARLAP